MADGGRGRTRGGAAREGFKVGLPAVLLLAAGFVVAYQFVGPPPPDHVVLATGSEQGSYHEFGQRFAEIVGRAGIEVELRTSAGSVQNVQRLLDGETDIAFVQGGTVPAEARERLKGIGSLYYEPLWIFHRTDIAVARVADLAGRRIDVGPPGSGTRAVALRLFAANGIDASNSTLSEASGEEAVDRLLQGEADAVCLVGAATSGAIGRLLDQDGVTVRLLDFERTLAYQRRFRFLTAVVLGRGVIDFDADVPDRDIHLLAPTAGLVAREGLHPAVVPLFIEAAREIHGPGDLFEETGEFPSPRGLDVPLAEEAARYYEKGPSFLYRVLPFQVAAIVDRLKILLLPLITLLFPLLKVVPPLYRWRIRSKVYRWYGVLWDVEDRAHRAAPDAEPAALRDELAVVEREIYATKVPPSYMEELYNLRWHLERVQQAVRAQVAEGEAPAA